MERLSMIINGWDCSFAFNRTSAGYAPVKVEGRNSGTATDGTDIIDLIRVKDSWTLPGNALNAENYAKLLAICSLDYVTATYPHPSTGEPVTKAMVPTLSEAARKPITGRGIWYAGWTLTLKER